MRGVLPLYDFKIYRKPPLLIIRRKHADTVDALKRSASEETVKQLVNSEAVEQPITQNNQTQSK